MPAGAQRRRLGGANAAAATHSLTALQVLAEPLRLLLPPSRSKQSLSPNVYTTSHVLVLSALAAGQPWARAGEE